MGLMDFIKQFLHHFQFNTSLEVSYIIPLGA